MPAHETAAGICQRKVHARTICDDGSVCAGLINKARQCKLTAGKLLKWTLPLTCHSDGAGGETLRVKRINPASEKPKFGRGTGWNEMKRRLVFRISGRR